VDTLKARLFEVSIDVPAEIKDECEKLLLKKAELYCVVVIFQPDSFVTSCVLLFIRQGFTAVEKLVLREHVRQLSNHQLQQIVSAYESISQNIGPLLERRLELPEEQEQEMDSSQSLLYSLSSLTTDLMESDFASLKHAAHDRPSMTARHLFQLVALGRKAKLAVNFVLACPVEKRDQLLAEAGALASDLASEDAVEQQEEQTATMEALRQAFHRPAPAAALHPRGPHPVAHALASGLGLVPPPPVIGPASAPAPASLPPRRARHLASVRSDVDEPSDGFANIEEEASGEEEYRPGAKRKGLLLFIFSFSC
jgi:hypothetical protein